MMYEDELPDDLTDTEYDEWYKQSFIDGVRIGPDIERRTTMNKETTVGDATRRVLDAPSAHDLSDCLRELKFGRPANQQNWLDDKIEELCQQHSQ